jgi:hypothetical protein
MSAYNSSDTFQQTSSTESNGYNVFPAAYMSKGVGGKRTKRVKSIRKNKKSKMMKKGGDCGCSNNSNKNQSLQKSSNSYSLFGGKRKTNKNKTKKNKW